MKKEQLNLATLSEVFANEDKAREFLEKKRWPNGAICPHCKNKEAYKLTPKAGSTTRAGLYKCKACRKQFTVKVGTIFEDSKIPLCKWLMSIHLMCSSKKGVSAKQIEREVGVTYKSAWFMCHRIREAMKLDPLSGMLGGGGKTVEADETYVGGKPRYKGAHNPRGSKNKPPVTVLVERGGNAVSRPVENVTGATLRNNILAHVDRNSKIVTDQFASYRGIGRAFTKGHEAVNHSLYYVNPRTLEHTNTAESFFATFKRGYYGIYHSMSKQHLDRYCNEFAFRWNHRKVSDGERMIAAIEGVQGKRLLYKNPISSKSKN